MTAKFRAYASYAESFPDYARLMKDSPRYAQVVAQRPTTPSGFAQRPAARRLRHRPGLRRQAEPRHQHHAAPAARDRPETRHERPWPPRPDVARHPGDDRELRRAADRPATTSPTPTSRATRASRSSWPTAAGQFTGAGFFGKGVDVATVTRSHDAVPDARGGDRAVAVGAATPRALEQLQQLENVFADRRAGSATRPGSSSTRWSTWPAGPADLRHAPGGAGARRRAGRRASRAAGRRSSTTCRPACTRTCKASVAQVNDAGAAASPQLNQQIAARAGPGPAAERPARPARPPDQPTSASTCRSPPSTADDGTVGVFIAGGQRLVLGGQAAQLALSPDPYRRSRWRCPSSTPAARGRCRRR